MTREKEILNNEKRIRILIFDFEKKVNDGLKIMRDPNFADVLNEHKNDKLRISYATEFGKLKEAMDRIEDFIKNL